MAVNEIMRAPSTSAHWNRAPGYIKGSWQGPVCGIAEKVDGWVAYSLETQKHLVTCEWCLYWLWEQEQPAKKLDVSKALDDRIVNMSFDNRGMSAHDTEKAIADGVEKGIKAGLDKVRSDFFESDAVGNMLRALVKQSMRDVLSEATTKANHRVQVKEALRGVLQESLVRRSLITLHKRADDEIEAEYDSSGQAETDQQERMADMKSAVREVLEETGVGTQFVQNNYAPEALSPTEIYNQTAELITFGPSQTTTEINLTAEVDPKEFSEMTKKAVKEAADEWNDEHPENTLEEERLNTHRAIRDMFELPGFQRRFKDLVKQAIDEDQTKNDEEYVEWHKDIINNVLDERIVAEHKAKVEWLNGRFLKELDLPPTILNNLGDIVEGFTNRPVLDMIVNPPEEPVIHYRRLYQTATVCGLDVNDVNTTIGRGRVTCKDCKTAVAIN